MAVHGRLTPAPPIAWLLRDWDIHLLRRAWLRYHNYVLPTGESATQCCKPSPSHNHMGLTFSDDASPLCPLAENLGSTCDTSNVPVTEL